MLLLRGFLVLQPKLFWTKLGQGIGYHIVFPFDVPDIQIVFLQGQTPPHLSLIFVLPVDEG